MAKNNALRDTPFEVQKPAQAIPDLDRLIHPRIRLGIISALAAADAPLTFNDLKICCKPRTET